MRRKSEFKKGDAIAIVDRLKQIRMIWNIPVAELAKNIGCTRCQLHHVEAGEREPSFKTLVKWAEALGYELALVPKEVVSPVAAPPFTFKDWLASVSEQAKSVRVPHRVPSTSTGALKDGRT